MKKLLALLLAVMMVAGLTACGGSNDPVESDPPVESETASPVGITDQDGNEVSQETIDALTQAYNAIAVQYNEIATTVNENGWMADEQTAAEIEALNSTVGFVGAALTEDITMLDGTDFERLISMLEDDLPTALDALAERVNVPYGG